jgi:hypothetical protein
MKIRGARQWLASWLMIAMGETLAESQGIYTCVDKFGRKFTADRPIPECMDREQKILNPSGTVKSIVPPPKSEKELAELAAQKRKDAEIQAQLEDEKKRDRALIARYPNKAAHDKSRAEALKEISAVRAIALSRVKELMAQRDKIAAELEFYKKEPEAAPASLRRRAEENTRNTSEQRQFMAHQDQEEVRTNARFDEELTRLRPQWAMRDSAVK